MWDTLGHKNRALQAITLLQSANKTFGNQIVFLYTFAIFCVSSSSSTTKTTDPLLICTAHLLIDLIYRFIDF